jgi:hypothetical protein
MAMSVFVPAVVQCSKCELRQTFDIELEIKRDCEGIRKPGLFVPDDLPEGWVRTAWEGDHCPACVAGTPR